MCKNSAIVLALLFVVGPLCCKEQKISRAGHRWKKRRERALERVQERKAKRELKKRNGGFSLRAFFKRQKESLIQENSDFILVDCEQFMSKKRSA